MSWVRIFTGKRKTGVQNMRLDNAQNIQTLTKNEKKGQHEHPQHRDTGTAHALHKTH